MMTSSDTPRRCLAVLRAFDESGRLVVQQELDLHDYWDGDHPLIDSDVFRAERAIVRVVGNLYDDDGALSQRFENRYGPAGEYLGGRAEHADGTVIED